MAEIICYKILVPKNLQVIKVNKTNINKLIVSYQYYYETCDRSTLIRKAIVHKLYTNNAVMYHIL